MSIKISNYEIELTVRDLLLPQDKTISIYSSFSFPQRGKIGKDVQKQFQQKKSSGHAEYLNEYPVSYSIRFEKYHILIRGKIDGVNKRSRIWEIEEIKSVILTPDIFGKLTVTDVHNFAEQLLFYCFILDQTENPKKLKPILRLVNLTNQQVRSFHIKFDAIEIENLLNERIELIIRGADHRSQLINKRDQILQTFEYPFKEKRKQQEKMIEEVHTAVIRGNHLLISAPTGIGKTGGALYPVLKFALSHGKKVFYATAKNTQQRIVLETITPFKQKNMDLSVVFLRAAQKMCLNDTFFCHDDYCQYITDFDTRFHDSGIAEILDDDEIVEPDRVMHLAQRSTLCPAKILIETSLYTDCIVGDYNYIFEPAGSMRHIFMGENVSDWIVIIDEVHNLYQRGLDYLSPQLSRSEINKSIQSIGQSRKKILSDLKKSLLAVKKILDEFQEEGRSAHSDRPYYLVEPDTNRIYAQFANFESNYIRYLIDQVNQKQITECEEIQEIYYKLRRFIYVLDQADDRYQIFYRADSGGILQIQCCDPSLYLTHIINGFHSVIGMSATIEPLGFYQSVLGFSHERSRLVSLDSPFMNRNRRIVIIPDISTRFKHRTVYYPHYAELIKKIIRQRTGNYIAYFPSFEFLQSVNLFLGDTGFTKLMQKKSMTESERSEMLDIFKGTDHPHLLLAILGGIFSESIDLKGDNCIGVIIFSPAFPKVSVEKEIIRYYYDQKSGDGFEHAYIIPGMNKVIQAAGRLIRSAMDRGVIVIIGERFNEESLNRLFPDYWFKNPGDVVFTTQYEDELNKFWESFPEKLGQ